MKCLSHWYAVSRAYGCTLIPLHRPSCPQIWGFRFTWGVEMMPQHHGWGWYSFQTTSYIHIRHIQSVWDIGMLSQGHMATPLFCYTGQAGPRFGDSGSLVEWKLCHNVMVEADTYAPLIAIVSCKCQHSSSTLRGTSSPRPNMAYQPAFPHKASCQGSVTAKIEYCVKSILRTCLYIKSILCEIVTM